MSVGFSIEHMGDLSWCSCITDELLGMCYLDLFFKSSVMRCILFTFENFLFLINVIYWKMTKRSSHMHPIPLYYVAYYYARQSTDAILLDVSAILLYSRSWIVEENASYTNCVLLIHCARPDACALQKFCGEIVMAPFLYSTLPVCGLLRNFWVFSYFIIHIQYTTYIIFIVWYAYNAATFFTLIRLKPYSF